MMSNTKFNEVSDTIPPTGDNLYTILFVEDNMYKNEKGKNSQAASLISCTTLKCLEGYRTQYTSLDLATVTLKQKTELTIHV